MRVLVVDDQDIVRPEMARLLDLEAAVEVVARPGTGTSPQADRSALPRCGVAFSATACELTPATANSRYRLTKTERLTGASGRFRSGLLSFREVNFSR